MYESLLFKYKSQFPIGEIQSTQYRDVGKKKAYKAPFTSKESLSTDDGGQAIHTRQLSTRF